ncbi:MAG: hypothetical protein KDB72_14255 [Mycobacterium sp.]|nr:hypothetical protein [Mycobacterium sp.]
MNRIVSAAFGLLMATAAGVDARGPGLVAAVFAGVAVLAGLRLRVAATAAVLAAAGAIALAEPLPLFAAVSGVAAAAYLVLRHTTMTGPTVAGLVGFAVAGVGATTVPAGWSWLPLVAPVAVVLIFLALIGPFVDDERPGDASAADRPALGYE